MKKTLTIISLFVTICTYAQEERKTVREGNKLYENGEFEKSETEYRRALEQKNDSYEASFNLGDALFKQKKFEQALETYKTLADKETDKNKLGELYHNIGNTYLEMQKVDESIDALKKSLRNRPNSMETKYNLEYAKQLKQEQEQQNQDNKDQNKDKQDQNQDKDQENKDQNKDKQDQNQDKDQESKDQNKDKQDQNQDKDQESKDQNKDKQDQNQDKQNQQPQPGKISKQDAERLLEALQGDEQKVQEKVQKEKMEAQKAQKMKIEKDW